MIYILEQINTPYGVPPSVEFHSASGCKQDLLDWLELNDYTYMVHPDEYEHAYYERRNCDAKVSYRILAIPHVKDVELCPQIVEKLRKKKIALQKELEAINLKLSRVYQ